MKIINKTNELKKHETKRYKKRSINAIKSIAIHHSATKTGSPEAFARYHVNIKNWPGIGYAYVIDKDGVIYQTNELTTVAYHVGNSNYKSVGICLIGDFTVEETNPKQLQAAAYLCLFLMQKLLNLEVIKGHSEFPGYSWKKCPAFDVLQILNRIKGV